MEQRTMKAADRKRQRCQQMSIGSLRPQRQAGNNTVPYGMG